METFAYKVRYGGGWRFDPMLEERGGWTSGEAQCHDVDMPDAVIEVLAEANKLTSKGELNPFKQQLGEILPSNMERNFSGFLMRKDAIPFKVNTQKLNARIALLKDQLLIAKFVGTKPQIQDMNKWLQTLNHELGSGSLSFCRDVGKGFFFLMSEDSDALHSALMLSPFKSKWRTCMFQSWIPGFNPDNPSNLAFPTWVALRRLPFEHHDQAIAIAGTLGEVIGIDTSNETAKDPRFCVNLKVKEGWITSIVLETEDSNIPPQRVIVDYDKLPMRCRACQSWLHRVRDCKEIQKKPRRGPWRQPPTYHTNNQEKGKHIAVDEEGFQQVRNRRNIRRNIFENGKDLRGKDSYPRTWDGNAEVAKNQKERSKSLVEGHEGSESRYNEQQSSPEKSEEHPGGTNWISKEAAEEVEKDAAMEDTDTRIGADSPEGMKWSPIKQAGRKRSTEERPDAEEDISECNDEQTYATDRQVDDADPQKLSETWNTDTDEGEG